MTAEESGARDFESILREVLARHPELSPFLGRLCDVWDRQGAPPGRLALGHGLARHGELAALHALFGSAVHVSHSGGASLDVSAFLGHFTDREAEAWGEALYRVMGRPRRDRVAERLRASQEFEALLAEWRQEFPAAAGAAAILQDRDEFWKRRLLESSVAAVRAQWWPWGKALAFLTSRPEPLGLADLGARCYSDSKALRAAENRRFLAAGLAALEGLVEGEVDPRDLLRRFGICDNPTALKVTVFGPLRLRKHGRWLDWVEQLHALGESATLSLANLDGVDIIGSAAAGALVHTCENETPFCRLVREGCPGTLVYTEGYPNRAVRRLLQLLPSGTTIRHWGDSDLDGLRIAAILAQDRPLQLWRCGLADLERQREFLIPLSMDASRRARHWLQTHPEFRFRDELAFTLAHGWLEQESWRDRE
jgi:uncharacterized protein (TIGR02679 family)